MIKRDPLIKNVLVQRGHNHSSEALYLPFEVLSIGVSMGVMKAQTLMGRGGGAGN